MSFKVRLESPEPLRSNANKQRGVHLGIVVDNKEGEGNPGYRIKVKLPALSDTDHPLAGSWCRWRARSAGPTSCPRSTIRSCTVFEHGDINKPVVIGALWSKEQPGPEINETGKNNTKLIS